MRPARLVSAACLVTILALGGCSDSDNDDAAGTTSTTGARATSSLPVDTRFTGEGSAEFCRFLNTFNEGMGTGGTAPGVDYQAALEALDQMVAVAPDDLKANLVTLSDGLQALVTAASAPGFNPNTLDPAVVTVITSPDFSGSLGRLDAYYTKYCGTGG